MNRREFIIKSSAGSVIIPSLIEGKTIDNNQDVFDYNELNAAKTVLKNLENEFISFTYFSDATADIKDKKTGQSWKMGPVAFQEDNPIEVGHVWLRQDRTFCERYPGRFSGVKQGEGIKFTVLGHGKKAMGSFTTEVKLNGPWLEFDIKNIDESLSNLMFPTPIESEMLVVPRGVGQLVRKPIKERFFWTFFSHLNMRWFGGLKQDKGWICVFDEGFEDGGVMATQLSAFPGWLRSLGKWTPSRKVRYSFSDGGYVGLAKIYRKVAIEKGLHVSLTEKIKINSALKNMVGGRQLSFYQANPGRSLETAEDLMLPANEVTERYNGKLKVNVTYKEVNKIMEEAQSLGMKSGMSILRGWIKGGYDYSHPDIWPPLPELGSTNELKELCSKRGNITVGLHDNYQDIYEWCPSFPKGINLNPTGDLMAGGFWAPGQTYILNSRNSVQYAKRNWEQIKTLNTNCMFVDTTTAMQLFQSYEKGNTQTRSQDLQYKKELMKFFKDKGQLFGSEESADFGIPYCDWLENRHTRVAGESIPLWPLVFHDAVFCGRYNDYKKEVETTSNHAPVWIDDLLWGYFTLFGFHEQNGWDDTRKQIFKKTFVVDDWHKKVGLAEMSDHKYLTDDFQVEQTIFSSGHSIICNYSAENRVVNGQTIPAFGYKMLG